MRYTEILYLIKETLVQDEIGNVKTEEVETKVYAQKNAVGSKEFYNAVAVGITPTAELQIRLSNYNNETKVRYNDKIYSIIRTIPKERHDLVLVIGLKEGING